ncbi:hypothetical protein ABVK25_010273 [Lepraria finkii]|uniref:Uncharacterized protein n=1 Tax=Lepraria finkii TaxID=1340010 RepID=A0ABR4B150_9LECA
MIVGIVAAMLLAAGLLPPYAELWKRGGRVMATHLDFWPLIGWGLFFALMEIVAQTTFDPLGGCLFIVWYVLSTLIKSWHRLLIMQSKISSSKVAFSSPTASGGSSARVSSAPPPKRLAAPSTTFLNQNLTMSTCQEEEV